jgi:hypothetical protein
MMSAPLMTVPASGCCRAFGFDCGSVADIDVVMEAVFSSVAIEF